MKSSGRVRLAWRLWCAAVAASLVGGALADGGTGTARWVSLMPERRYGHAMCYNPATGYTVMFGGISGNPLDGITNETWIWTHGWTCFPCPAPGARYGHALAFDPVSGRVLMFGGYSGNALQGETWKLSDQAWVRVATEGPAPRTEFAMVTDSARMRVVLFGGWAGQRKGDTWEWDGSAWSERNVAGPSPRYGHAMAYDSARQRVVLFGGWAGGLSRETWEWDGSAWELVASNGPSARAYHAMMFDTSRGETILIGGDDGNLKHDVWAWNGDVWQRLPDSDMTARDGHAVAFDEERGVGVLHAGHAALSILADTWTWDGWSWNPRTGELSASGPVALDLDRQVIVATGYTGPWEWDGITWRQVASMFDTDAAASDCLSGRGVLVSRDGLSRWDGYALTQVSPEFHGGRNLACDCARGRLVSYHYGETWEFDGSAWTLRDSGALNNRDQVAMAFDEARQQVVLFGGSWAEPPRNDLWAWDGNQWNPITIGGASPPGRWDASMCYDPNRGGLLLRGGTDWYGQAFIDTWLLKGETWTCLDGGGDSIGGGGVAYDPFRNAMILIPNPGSATRLLIPRVGDLNCDGSLNGFDIAPFILALSDPATYAATYPDCDILHGDSNGDGSVNGFDITGFIECLQ